MTTPPPLQAWLYTAAALVADGLVALAGGLLSERWLSRHLAGLVGFAAGALLAATFLDILPESIDVLGTAALPWAFGSFVALAIFQWGTGPHHHEHHHDHGEVKDHVKRVLPATLLTSDALHNVGDGAAVAATFLASPETGLLTAVAVIAHELPQEVGDYALLRASGYSRGRALLALAVVQATAVLGAALVLLAASFFKPLTGVVLSIAAGSFLYISATDLLPELYSGHGPADRRERMLGFLGGCALILAALGISSALGVH